MRDLRSCRRCRGFAAPQRALGNPGDLAGGRPHLGESWGVFEDLHAVAENDLVVHTRRLVGSREEVLHRGDDHGLRGRGGGRGPNQDGGEEACGSVLHGFIIAP